MSDINQASKKLNEEYLALEGTKTDPEGLVPLDDVIVNSEFEQLNDGTWAKTQYEDKNPVEKPSTIFANELEKTANLIDSYKTSVAPVDKKLVEICGQINAKKLEIIDTIYGAVSFGCSFLTNFGGIDNFDDVYGTGTDVGYGFTALADNAYYHGYGNLNNYSTFNPFDPEVNVKLTNSNLGSGDRTYITVNDTSEELGSITGIGTSSITRFVIDPTPPLGPDCTSQYNTVISLCGEIDALRSTLTGIILTDVNAIKGEKTSEEIKYWGIRKDNVAVEDRQTEIQSSQASLKNLSDQLNTL